MPAQAARRIGLQVRDVIALEHDRASGWRVDPHHGLAQCGLATAAFADNSQDLALVDIQRHVIQRPQPAGAALPGIQDREVFLDPFQSQQGSSRRGGHSAASCSRVTG
jgi:hypothetical protein